MTVSRDFRSLYFCSKGSTWSPYEHTYEHTYERFREFDYADTRDSSFVIEYLRKNEKVLATGFVYSFGRVFLSQKIRVEYVVTLSL